MRQKIICYIYDEAVNFKGIDIYPIKVSEYFEFYNYIDCLQIDKNSVPDVKVISMSYLDYLISISDANNFYYSKMVLLLKLCLHLKDFSLTTEDAAKSIYESGKDLLLSELEHPEKDEDVIVINRSGGKSWEEIHKIINEAPKKMFYFDGGDIVQIVKKNGKNFIQIKDEFYSSDDFDQIRKIILEQNDVEQIDENIKKEVRDELDALQSKLSKLTSSVKMCDFEDQMICLSVSVGFTLDQIKDMTIRKFKKYIARIDNKLTYEIFKPPMLSGFITSKDKNFPLHWMADLSSDNKYSNIFVDEDEIKSKIN